MCKWVLFCVVYSTNTQWYSGGCAGAAGAARACSRVIILPPAHSGYSKIVVFTLALHNGVFTTYSSKSLELNLPGIDYAALLLLVPRLLYCRCSGYNHI